jgi:hypothetical protein
LVREFLIISPKISYQLANNIFRDNSYIILLISKIINDSKIALFCDFRFGSSQFPVPDHHLTIGTQFRGDDNTHNQVCLSLNHDAGMSPEDSEHKKPLTLLQNTISKLNLISIPVPSFSLPHPLILIGFPSITF